MKNFIKPLILCVSVAAVQSSRGAYTTNFEPPLYATTGDLAGQNGWVIDDPEPGVSGFVNYALDENYAGMLGGVNSSPTLQNVNLTHAYEAAASGTSFDVDFLVFKSGAAYPGRDSFGWSFKTATSDLFRVAFEPGTDPARLKVVWYDNFNVAHDTLNDIYYGGDYHLRVAFGKSGSNLTFSANLTGTNPVGWGTSLIGAASAQLASIGADFDVTDPTVDGGLYVNAGGNFMTFDNISINTVPEPSSALLGIAAGAMMMSRRRK